MSNNLSKILVPIGIAGIVIFAFFFGVLWQKVQYLEKKNGTGAVLSDTTSEKSSQPSVLSPIKANSLNLSPVNDKDHVKGSKDAVLTWIEYSDLECPFCKQMHTVLQKMLQSYNGKVRWVYRHFPLDSLHSKARSEAVASECAAKLGGEEFFWTYVDKVFESTPSNNGLDPSQLPQIAVEMGLNKNAFEKCLSSGTTSQKVTEDSNGGIRAQVNGTPANFLLDGKGNAWVLSGAVPYETVKQAIEEALK